MTENKRFGFEMDKNCYKCIVDIRDKKLYTDKKQVVGLLNQLNDENEQLKTIRSDLIFELDILMQNWEALDKEKDEQLDKQNHTLKKIKGENEQLKHNNKMLSMKMSEVYTKYCLLNEFSDDTNPNDAVKRILSELMQITKEYR